MFCLLEIGLWNYYDGSTEIRDVFPADIHTPLSYGLIHGQHMIPRSQGYEIGDRNFSREIWKFPTPEMEKIYLYKKLLTKEHSFNRTNLKVFRNELQDGMGAYFKKYFIIDQQNTPANYTFKFGNRKNSPKLQISEDIHKLLPKNSTSETIPRCSVVGNSGSILNTKCGKDIDKADFVFRCNAAPIQLFATDAGYKSNLTTFNPSILSKRYKRISNAKSLSRFLMDMKRYHGYIWTPCYTISGLQKCIKIFKVYNLTENTFVMGHPGHFPKVQAFWNSRGFTGRLSSGFYLVNVALTRCSELHLYGFWPFPKEVDKHIKEVPYHYFENMKFKTGRHDMNFEFSVLLQLHLHGVLKLHAGECDL